MSDEPRNPEAVAGLEQHVTDLLGYLDQIEGEKDELEFDKGKRMLVDAFHTLRNALQK